MVYEFHVTKWLLTQTSMAKGDIIYGKYSCYNCLLLPNIYFEIRKDHDIFSYALPRVQAVKVNMHDHPVMYMSLINNPVKGSGQVWYIGYPIPEIVTPFRSNISLK